MTHRDIDTFEINNDELGVILSTLLLKCYIIIIRILYIGIRKTEVGAAGFGLSRKNVYRMVFCLNYSRGQKYSLGM